MNCVLLRLEGALQSWGTRSRFPYRDTEREPSKSGVLGLVAAALGMPRDDEARLERLAAARMAVRVDREGGMIIDFQTAGGGRFNGEDHAVHGTQHPVITRRQYLTGASFLVALGFEDLELAREVAGALQSPRWSIFLGRRACAPSLPVYDGVADGEPEVVLRTAHWPGVKPPGGPVRLVVECAPHEGEPRQDVPLSFALHARGFARRFVRTGWIAPDELKLPSEDVPRVSLLARGAH